MIDLISATWPIWSWMLSGLLGIEVARQVTQHFQPDEYAEMEQEARRYFGDHTWPLVYAVSILLGPILLIFVFGEWVFNLLRR